MSEESYFQVRKLDDLTRPDYNKIVRRNVPAASLYSSALSKSINSGEYE